ncbi:MAG: UvrD-helicase domain-containing protein [Candidatus Dojkabacteria bacterium]|nr:UvrD-helicase domain-containing protein [Candidatus Dojkabacteria bacterium]
MAVHDDLLKDLNEAQTQAVLHENSPLLILAGAGSGKTKVLTHRMGFFYANGMSSNRILGVTFTNKAATEMKDRIRKIVKKDVDFPFLGTFHSICVKILRIDGKYIGIEPSFTIYDTDDQKDLIKEALKIANLDPKEVSPGAIQWAIASAKNDFLTPEKYTNFVNDYFTEVVAKIYSVYQNLLEERNGVDFDDLLLKVVLLFKSNQTVLEKYIDKFDLILVDEYQDTNKIQYELIKLLSSQKRNLTVVGDDDQSIYAWRGADITNILNFEKDFPEAKVVKLEQNYRSTQIILDAANHVISKNTARRDKSLWSVNKNGPLINVYEAQNEQDEANFVVREIKNKFVNNLKDVAVLFRANSQSRYLEESFLKSRLPYKIVGGQRFYERKEIKDIIAYLRILVNKKDVLSLNRIINFPTRGIGPKTITDILDFSKEQNISPVDTLLISYFLDRYKNVTYDDIDDVFGISGIQNDIKTQEDFAIDEIINLDSDHPNFITFIENLRSKYQNYKTIQSKSIVNFGEVIYRLYKALFLYSLSDFINYLIDLINYKEALKDSFHDYESRIENLSELANVASKYDNLDTYTALHKLLEDVSLLENIQERKENNDNVVTLMTIHASKGLEFETVFIVGMEEGIFPHSRTLIDLKEIEEERRLAYVAITRAKKNLYMTYALNRNYYNSTQSNRVSRFLEDIPEHLLNKITNFFYLNNISINNFTEEIEAIGTDDYIDIGDRVFHKVFGYGKVDDLYEDMIVIDFDISGKKKLIQKFARLKKISS